MPIFQALGPGQVAAWCPACHSPPSAPQSCRLRCGRRTFLKSRPSCQWRGHPKNNRGFCVFLKKDVQTSFLLFFLLSYLLGPLGERATKVGGAFFPPS